MDTEELMKVALELGKFDEIPEDSAIYVRGEKIKKVIFGIDAGVPELLLAVKHGYDAVIAHHPQGGDAVLNFHRVFSRHVQQMVAAGIPLDKAENAVKEKKELLKVQAHSQNYAHKVDVARFLNVPYMNIHTPLDEVGRRIMWRKIDENQRADLTVQDVVKSLKQLPEFQNAATDVKILIGKPENPAGRVVVSHGAGTNGGHKIATTYFEHGVDTVVYIHIHPLDLQKLKATGRGNLVVTGHIASDSVGINPYIRELRERGISVKSIGVVPPE